MDYFSEVLKFNLSSRKTMGAGFSIKTLVLANHIVDCVAQLRLF